MAALSMLQVIRDEIAGGWLASLRGLITAEVFADFMEMAEHFLEEGYKDAAAVIAGGVLEEHLRQLCGANGIDIEISIGQSLKPKKAGGMNSDLAKGGVYSKIDQKAVTSWLGIRNSAAHGKYNEYTAEQVRLLLQGIVEFIARVPA